MSHKNETNDKDKRKEIKIDEPSDRTYHDECKQDLLNKWSKQNANFSTALPIESIDELFETFTLFDKNYNGAINDLELTDVMKSISLNATNVEIDEMIDEVDADGNGLIDFPEFLAFLIRKTDSDKVDWIKTFKLFDPEDTGFLSSKNLISILEHIDEFNQTKFSTKEAIEDLFKKASIYGTKDKKNDYALSLKEFLKMMKPDQKSTSQIENLMRMSSHKNDFDFSNENDERSKKSKKKRDSSKNKKGDKLKKKNAQVRKKDQKQRKKKKNSVIQEEDEIDEEHEDEINKEKHDQGYEEDDEEENGEVNKEDDNPIQDNDYDNDENKTNQFEGNSNKNYKINEYQTEESEDLQEALLKEQNKIYFVTGNEDENNRESDIKIVPRRSSSSGSFKNLRHKSKDKKSLN